MEEFVHAEVNSYDAIIDGSGNPIFEAGNVSPVSIMDIVNDNDNSIYYIIKGPARGYPAPPDVPPSRALV